MSLFRKKNTAATIHGITLTERGSLDFIQNPTLSDGDVQISKDGGDFINLETLPVVSPVGSTTISISLSATEMDAEFITIRFVDQTATKQWEDTMVYVDTYTVEMISPILKHSRASAVTGQLGKNLYNIRGLTPSAVITFTGTLDNFTIRKYNLDISSAEQDANLFVWDANTGPSGSFLPADPFPDISAQDTIGWWGSVLTGGVLTITDPSMLIGSISINIPAGNYDGFPKTDGAVTTWGGGEIAYSTGGLSEEQNNMLIDLVDSDMGRWVVNTTANTLTKYRRDNITVLRVYDLTEVLPKTYGIRTPVA